MSATVLVYRVEGPGVHPEADYILTDNPEAAGRCAVEAAFCGWDDLEEGQRGPRIYVQCYEMPRAEYEELTEEGER